MTKRSIHIAPYLVICHYVKDLWDIYLAQWLAERRLRATLRGYARSEATAHVLEGNYPTLTPHYPIALKSREYEFAEFVEYFRTIVPVEKYSKEIDLWVVTTHDTFLGEVWAWLN